MKYLKIIALSLIILWGIDAQATTHDRDNDGVSDDAEIQVFGTDPDRPDNFQTSGEPKTSYTSEELAALKGLRRIDVDLSDLRLRYYAGDQLIGDIPISSGTAKYPSPLGTFSVLQKIPIKHYRGPGYDLPNTRWNLRFSGPYYIHGAYWHNDFGIRPRSHGCINVSYKDMPQLYEFAKVGTKVTIHK